MAESCRAHAQLGGLIRADGYHSPPPMSDPNAKTEPVVPDYRAPDPADSSLWAAIARRKSLVVVLGSVAFFLLSLVAYWPALRGDFVWDDDRYVSNNANL